MRQKVLLLGILLLAAFMRLFRISDYLTFLGDEGRDALIVYNILHGKLTLLGPTASVGGFFLGPIYYYFMTPFLFLFNYDPVGPAVMVALFGVATVYLTYRVGREFFNERVGLFAAALYAVSPLVIAYSRSSWNPNLMPFFSLVTLYTLYLAVAKRSAKLFVLTGILLGIAMQLHYLATFLGAVVGAFLLTSSFREVTVIIKRYLLIFFGFLIGVSPFLAFEVRHGFANTQTIIRFVFGATGETGFAGEKFTGIIWDVFFRLFARLVMKFPPPEQVSVSQSVALTFWQWGIVLLAISCFGLLVGMRLHAKGEEKVKMTLVSLWLSLGILLFGFYKKPIYDYYFGFMFPLPFLLVGNLISAVSCGRWAKGKALALALFFLLMLFNLSGSPFRYLPNRQKEQVKTIAHFVLEKTGGKPFNFALITGGNSDHAYRYFFKLRGRDPVVIQNAEADPKRATVTKQLLIVCETRPCFPLGDPLWEVAGFGRAEIAGQWNVSVVEVYRLVHY